MGRVVAHITVLIGLLTLMGSTGCRSKRISVKVSTPEETAASVGELLCRERQHKVRVILEEIDTTLALQDARQSLLFPSDDVDEVDSRLRQWAAFMTEHRDELLTCEAIQIDKDQDDERNRAYIAMKIRYKAWKQPSAKSEGKLELIDREDPVFLTLVEAEGEWRVTASNIDLAIPGGPVRSLLD